MALDFVFILDLNMTTAKRKLGVKPQLFWHFISPRNIVTIVTNVTPRYEMGVTMLVTFF